MNRTTQTTGSQPELVAAPLRPDLLRRKCACGQQPSTLAKRSGCCTHHDSTVHRSATGEDRLNGVPPIVHNVLTLPGQPLEASTRAFMEQRFGHDFSRVRVHADDRAADSARAVHAQAYSVGSQIVFAKGQYAPGATAGRRLLAHELAHVVQQGPVTSVPAEIAPANDTSELEADAIAERVTAESGANVPGPRPAVQTSTTQLARLMRAPDDPTSKAHYPTSDERSSVMDELTPQQQAAQQSGDASVDPVTDPAQFRSDMKSCMDDYVDKQVLPTAKARESSTASLGLPEVQSMADIAQREVERFYKPYLKAAVYSADEKKRMETFKLRDRIHMVSSKHAEADEIACNWLSSRMADACSGKLGEYNVLASVKQAKRSCSPSAASATATSTTAASTPANQRDQALFQSVRDDIQSARRADLQTIVKFQSSFQGQGESFIQDKIKPEAGDTGSQTLRRGRWQAFGTIIHEMLHAVAHEKFNEAISGVENQGVAVEGFAEYFTRTVYNDVKGRAATDDTLRSGIEGVNEPFDDSLAPERIGTTYDKYVAGVEKIKSDIAGNEESLRVAFFMGRVEYIGLGGWNATDAERHETLRYPANTFGFAALLTGDTRGLLTVDYTRLVVGRGKPFQIGLGAEIYYLTPGEHREADVTVPESGRLGVGGKAMLQYSWPNFYIRGSAGVGASVGFDSPFEQSVRLDLIPGVEAGVRIGWARIGAGTQLLIPIVGGPVAEKTVKAGGLLGVSADF